MRYLLTLFVMCAAVMGQEQYDGTNDHISGLTLPNTSIFTVCFTMKRDLGNLRPAYYSDNILKFGSGNIGRMSISYVSDPSWLRAWPNRTNVVGYALGIPVALGECYSCAVVSSADGVKVYIDGVLRGTTTVDKITWSLNTVTRIASTWTGGDEAGGGNYFFDGFLEDFRIYTRALSASEPAEIYALPWSLADDPALVLRMCIVTNDTGTALTGVARNYGTGADGAYKNSPTAAQPHIQTEKPLTMELP